MKHLITKQFYRFCKAVQIVQAENKKISKFQLKNFSDSVKLRLKGGSGGNGMISFYSDKKIRFGQPDGGDGGQGGNIIIQAHKSMHDLSHLRLKTIEGNIGHNGGNQGKQGKQGGKTMIRVPVGTTVFDIKLQQGKQIKTYLFDLNQDKENHIVCRGGQAGKGNQNHQNMKEQQRFGKQGQQKIIYIQLKTLADIGLVGFPNIGKSTFLAATTRAMPKIANYQFTTLKPSVGHVKFVDDYSMTIADIPGIIENAHANKGLGFQFLRHIERTKIIVFLLDITHKDPLQHYRILQNELKIYKDDLFKNKKRIAIFNKKDCIKDSEKKYKIFSQKIGIKSFLISAKQGDGIGQVLVQLRKLKQSQDLRQNQQKQAQKIKIKNQERVIK